MKSALVSAAALTFTIQGLRLVGNLALVPILLSRLGHELYALLSVALAYVSTGTLLESFLTPVLRNKLVSHSHMTATEEERHEADTVLHSSLRLTVGLAIAALVSCQYAASLGLSTMALVAATLMCALVVVASGFAEADFAARDKLVYARSFELLFTVTGLAATYLLATLRPTAHEILILLAACSGAGRIFAHFVYSAGKSAKSIDLRATARFYFRNRNQSSTFAFGQLCLLVNSVTPITLLAHFSPPEIVSTYSIVQRVVSAPANLFSSTFNVFWPAITRAIVSRNAPSIRKSLMSMTSVIVLGTIIASIFGAVSGSSLIYRWTSGGIDPATAIIVGFTILAGLQTAQAWLSIFLNASGDFGYQTRVYICLTAFQTIAIAGALRASGPALMLAGMSVTVLVFGIGGLAMGIRRLLVSIER